MPNAGEFELIERFLSRLGARRPDVLRGVGDDAAVVRPPADVDLALAADTLVAGRHFPMDLAAADVGYRALAVNLSDLAAMGAEPAWALLTLTLPDGNPAWVEAFAAGLDELARRSGVAVVGGDTTAGPLCISVAVTGFLPRGAALTRSGARPGDSVWISGWPGDAAAGLAVVQRQLAGPAGACAALEARFRRPKARLALGRALLGRASACIDVSDGLAGDLGKLCAASGVAADIHSDRLPVSAELRAVAGAERARHFALAGGDDYELLFTLPAHADAPSVDGIPVTCIGSVRAGGGITIDGRAPGRELGHGFDHFDSRG